MKPENIRLSILVSLVICSGMLFIAPVNLVLNTESVFDDPAVKRMNEERVEDFNTKGQLILKITHDDGRSITSDFSLVQKLMQLEAELSSSDYLHQMRCKLQRHQMLPLER